MDGASPPPHSRTRTANRWLIESTTTSGNEVPAEECLRSDIDAESPVTVFDRVERDSETSGGVVDPLILRLERLKTTQSAGILSLRKRVRRDSVRSNSFYNIPEFTRRI